MRSEDKIIRSIYVSKKLWEKARAEGINISELLNNVLEELLDDSQELELTKIEEEIKALRQRLLTLELKRQQILKLQAEKQKERNREAELYKLINEFLKLREQETIAKTETELEKVTKLKLKVLQEIYKVAGIQRGTSEFYTFSKLINREKVEEAIQLAKALWKKEGNTRRR